MEPRFIADKTVGKLTKWLRLLGYDCHYWPGENLDVLLGEAEKGKRILLTKNTHLFHKVPPDAKLLIESDHSEEQLLQVIRHFGLSLQCEEFLSVCSVCNVPVEDVDKESIRGEVPPYVFAKRNTFRRCPQCMRIYWAGTHKARMIARLQEVLDIDRSSRSDKI